MPPRGRRGGTSVRVSGPVFDGRAARAADELCEDLERELAQQGAEYVREETVVFVEPTGHYRGQIRARRVGSQWKVGDGRVVYGAWLERGGPKTFPGYHLWAKATQRLQAFVPRVARKLMAPAVRKMGGRR